MYCFKNIYISASRCSVFHLRHLFLFQSNCKHCFVEIMKKIIIRLDESHRRNVHVFLHGFFPDDNHGEFLCHFCILDFLLSF
jgi:hypothetical protein